ncbi:MAG: ribosomal subunit interface protein [Candidatus Vogelbacteria bacterium CG10_big_fil_rev_8_21_14_0_10_45_14]|uniref:Ribosomal subunit interface protein n=1 Tax=Candidatus Vogelbacteria bacterium CG10_big_fil_rev_8_21_14_0_10_45_14 TaxID=1975042 RepID=A0A2H0RIY8_9BACT|nr:MAG: ribosomal subunit interface protein [Candidatus Vogelbacteria bacterium CG10_big_fil_rev_8_21_14_0_10_45_14]
MKINIKATNIELTDAITDYLSKKIEMLEKFIDATPDSVFCDAEIGRTTKHHKGSDIFRAEINLHAAGKYFRAVSEKDNLYASIDEAKDEIARELNSHKTKKETLVRRGGRKVKKILKHLRF